MVWLKSALKFMMACWFGFWVVTTFLALYPFMALALTRPAWYVYAHRIRKAGARWVLFWGGIRVRCVAEQPLDAGRTYVITPNHTSKLDMIILTAMVGTDFNFIGKSVFGDIPLFGLFFRTIDIPIDVKNAAMAYKRALQQLGEGKSLVMFPEGTISRIIPQLSPFKEGAFRMAIEKQVDVLPVTMIGNWDLLPDNGPFYFKPGTITVHIHAPVSTRGMQVRQSDALAARVSAILEGRLRSAGVLG